MQHLFEVERGIGSDGRLLIWLSKARYANRYRFSGKAKAMDKARELVRARYPEVMERFRKEAMEHYSMANQSLQCDDEHIGQYAEELFEKFFQDNWHGHIWYATDDEKKAPYQLRIYSDAKKYRLAKQKARERRRKEMKASKDTQMRTPSGKKRGRPKKTEKNLENNPM